MHCAKNAVGPQRIRGPTAFCTINAHPQPFLPGGRRKVRPDGVWQAPEIRVPVLMVEVDRFTMAPPRVLGSVQRTALSHIRW